MIDRARITEEYTVHGERLVATARRLIRAGNVRRLIIKNEEGRTLIEVPLTVSVVGALVAPVWAAIGAVAALVSDCSIVVEREAPRAEPRAPTPPAYEPSAHERAMVAAAVSDHAPLDEQC